MAANMPPSYFDVDEVDMAENSFGPYYRQQLPVEQLQGPSFDLPAPAQQQPFWPLQGPFFSYFSVPTEEQPTALQQPVGLEPIWTVEDNPQDNVGQSCHKSYWQKINVQQWDNLAPVASVPQQTFGPALAGQPFQQQQLNGYQYPWQPQAAMEQRPWAATAAPFVPPPTRAPITPLAAPPAAAQTPAKRRVGRPRIHPLRDPSAPKRKAGRPAGAKDGVERLGKGVKKGMSTEDKAAHDRWLRGKRLQQELEKAERERQQQQAAYAAARAAQGADAGWDSGYFSSSVSVSPPLPLLDPLLEDSVGNASSGAGFPS